MKQEFHNGAKELIMRSKNENTLKAILEYINEWYYTNNDYPTLDQIAIGVQTSKATAYRYIEELIERGEIEKNSRFGNLVTKNIAKNLQQTDRIPIVGEIACGSPILAEENIEAYVTFSRELLGGGKFFILRAKGDSMINAGINDGDLVIVRQQETADEGQIVVALINDEATLKRYFRDKRRRKIRLHPENDEMEDMYFSSVSIQGVAVKILKDLK